MADSSFTPVPPPESLEAGGRALWHGIADSFELMPEQLVQLEEACRAKDRLDEFDSIIHGKGVLNLMKFRLSQGLEHHDGTEDDPLVVEVKFDNVISQSNATANLLKQLLAALRLPDEEGRRPQYRGARGAQAPSTPGGAAKSGSAADRASSRWGT